MNRARPPAQAPRLALAAMFSLAILAAATLFGGGARADAVSLQRPQIEQIIKQYLLAHPQVVQDALTKLAKQQRAQQEAESARAVADHWRQLAYSPHQAVVGNPKGKVTLVEFFDYNCPHCRNVVGNLGRLMKANPDLRLVLKDFPILTPQSVEAAHVAIALRSQFHGRKFWDWYKMLMTSSGLVGKTQALADAKSMGANMSLLAQDMKGPEPAASIKEVGALADAIHIDGTPSFILGGKVYAGEMTFAQLNALVAKVRKCGKVACS